jgi:hypothetical protein
MSDYVLVANVKDKNETAMSFSLKSSRVKGVYWAGSDSEYPLGIEFKNGDKYVYAVQHLVDNVRSLPLGEDCWHALTALLQYRDARQQISIGAGINKLLRNKCPYRKVEAF